MITQSILTIISVFLLFRNFVAFTTPVHFKALLSAVKMSGTESNEPLFPVKPYITLNHAKLIAQACREEAQRNGWPVVIAVMDDGANLIYLERMDGVQVGSIQVAQEKAAAAVRFKRPTKMFSDMVGSGSVNMMSIPGSLPVEGGLPIFFNKFCIGGIGISGVTSVQDGIIATAGLRAIE